MILPQEFYNSCCPTYQKKIDELEKKIAELNDQKEVRAAIMKFSRSCLLPKKYWDICFVYTGGLNSFDEWKMVCRETAVQAYCHMHCDKKWHELRFSNGFVGMDVFDGKYLKVIDFCNSERFFTGTESSIQFPHSDLDECFREFEKTTYQLPSNKLINRYKAMKALYSKIKAAEEDVNVWFNLLLEFDDFAFVKENVEYRLGKNYFDIQLWKLYFGFLKERGEHKLLILAYSKYCRFFLDDKEMEKEYEEAMIRFGPVCLPWDNLFDFEVNMEEGEEESPKLEAVLPLDKSLCSTFYDTRQGQNFSLPKPLVLYIIENTNHRVLRKLFSSCKYFFAKHPTPLCYRLDDGGCDKSAVFYGEKLSLSSGANPDLFMKNTYVTGSIDVGEFRGITRHFISKLIPHMYRCDAKFINLCDQDLSFDELKFLIKHGGVVELCLCGCRIEDENNELIDLEEVMKYLPDIESLRLDNIKVNAYTGHALSKLNFNANLSWVNIDAIKGEPFDENEFLNFCIANRSDELFRVEMIFDNEFNADFVEHFSKIMNDYKESSENTEVEICTFEKYYF